MSLPARISPCFSSCNTGTLQGSIHKTPLILAICGNWLGRTLMRMLVWLRIVRGSSTTEADERPTLKAELLRLLNSTLVDEQATEIERLTFALDVANDKIAALQVLLLSCSSLLHMLVCAV